MSDRNVMEGLLAKLGVEVAEGLSIERLTQRIVRRLTSNGAPTDVTDEEKALIEGLGFTLGAAPAGSEENPAPEVEGEGKRNYRLPGLAGDGGRVELITPLMAKTRNKNRKDYRRWVPLTEEEEAALVAKTAEPVEEEIVTGKMNETQSHETPEKEDSDTKENDVKKDKKKTETKAEKAPAKVEKKAPKDAPVKKSVAVKATVPEKGTKKETPATPKKTHGEGAAALFATLFASDKPVLKAQVLEKLAAAGVKPGTASSYVVWAKRPVSLGKTKNPFGFRIVETKDEKGVKFLARTTKLPAAK